MNKTRTTAFLLVLIFLVVAAVTFIFLSSLDKDDAQDNVMIVAPSAEPAAAEPVPTAVPTTPPSDGAATVTLAPAVSEPAPAATPAAAAPAPAAELIPAPTATPVPAATSAPAETFGRPLGSGSFTSDTGAKINIVADWVATTSGPDTAAVKVSVSVISYSLVTAAFPDRVHIGLNGQYISLGAPAINYTGAQQISSLLNDYTFTVNLSDGQSASLPLSVVWDYRGSYGEMQIDSIECGGTVSFSR